MSVLIKGIELPKGSARPCWVVIHSDGIVEYNENKGQGWQTSEAVLVPLHGRLIDADALLQRAIPHGWSTPKWVSDIAIDDAPTIIPAEE